MQLHRYIFMLLNYLSIIWTLTCSFLILQKLVLLLQSSKMSSAKKFLLMKCRAVGLSKGVMW